MYPYISLDLWAGHVVSQEDLEFIAALCVQHNVYVLSDEGETYIRTVLLRI